MRESLFCKLAGKSRNLLAIKADAATKECYVWGLRVGFLSYSIGDADTADSPLYTALEAKTAGQIRAVISNCSALSQRVVAKALTNEGFYEQRHRCEEIMRTRYDRTRRTLDEHPEYRRFFTAYPFNSGYFMCIRFNDLRADEVRRHLLDKYGAGGIAMGEKDFRLAFSSLDEEEIAPLFQTIYQACLDLSV